jgi:hypothetical protein
MDGGTETQMVNQPFRHKDGCPRIGPYEQRCLCWPVGGVVHAEPNRQMRRSMKKRARKKRG